MSEPLTDDRRARRLKPRQWQALDRALRADAVAVAHREERRRRRPEVVAICCESCGAELAMARQGAQVWCRSCRVWSGGPGERGMV